MSLKQIKFKTIIFLKKLPWIIATRVLLTSIFFLFLALLIAAIFYKYETLIFKIQPDISQELIQFREDLYQKILEEWENREERFNQADLKEYPNPFQ